MKECPVCNTHNNDEANVCMECGTRFENKTENSYIPQEQIYNQVNDTYNIPENIQNTHVNQVQNIQPVNNNNQYQQQSNYQQFNNANQYQQNNMPQNKKNKIVGLILNILLVGLGYAYVGKWGEGIVLAVVYVILLSLSILVIPFILAVLLWIYSLFKTNQMIDKYNQGLPY